MSKLSNQWVHGSSARHSTGLLREFYRWMRGSEQILVRPAAELPLVLITYAKGDSAGMEQLKQALEETWLTLPEMFRRRYADIVRQTPAFVVVLLRRTNLCGCLGHHHPQGTESRITRRLRGLSGVRTGEVDLAFEAIREWEPQPLSHLALPLEADSGEFRALQWRLALLAVFLHELHHLVQPEASEMAVRTRSQKLYTDMLSYFVGEQFGVEYGLRRSSGESAAGVG